MATTLGKRYETAPALGHNTREKDRTATTQGKRDQMAPSPGHNTREKRQNGQNTMEEGPDGAGPRAQH